MNENDRSPAAKRTRVKLRAAHCVTTTAWPVTCEDFTALPDHRFDVHSHVSPHLCLVVDGTLVERDGGRRRRLTAGAGWFSPVGDAHDLAIGDERPLRCLVLSMAPATLGEPDASGGVAFDDRRYAGGPGIADVASRLLEELRTLDDASPISLEMLGLEAAALLAGSTDPRIEAAPPWLERVRERLRDDLRAVPTLAELAREAGVSRAHLARIFRVRYGCTIGQFVRAQRLEVARRLLLDTDQSLSSIAYAAGFADQSHMTRLVGARFGHPPGRLRTLQSA